MKTKYSKISQIAYFGTYAVKSRLSSQFKKPLLCGFKLTYRCNLNCVHCPFWSKEKIPDPDFPQVKEKIRELYASGVRIVVFEGGEPLLWHDKKNGKNITDIIEFAREHFFFTCVATNGTLPLEDINADIIFISLDGIEESHNDIRGESFQKIIENIKKNAHHKKIIINTCISRRNFYGIPEMVKSLNKNVFGFTIQFFYPYPDVENLTLIHSQRKKIIEELIQLKKEGYKILDSYACLQKMVNNDWKCNDFLVASVEPDGKINHGCYLKNRVKDISCRDCGFAAHCEISLAYQFNFSALRSAARIFWGR